jgi:TM2 domain-containing membrane protein YozV
VKTCPSCAQEIQDAALVCRFCDARLPSVDDEQRARRVPAPRAVLEAPPPVVGPAAPASPVVVVAVHAWRPGVAALLSFLIPGAGQIYKGQIAQGIAWFVFVVVGYALFILPGLVLHLVCIVAAGSGQPPLIAAATGQPIATAATEAEGRARAVRARYWGWGAVAFIALVGVVTFVTRARPAPARTPSSPRSAGTLAAPTAGGDELMALLEEFGRPDGDTSSETEVPRPPIVTRQLTFTSAHVRAVYRANVPFGAPPPYTGTWKLVGFLDTRSNEKIGDTDARARLAERQVRRK